jgi:hypothetical protein
MAKRRIEDQHQQALFAWAAFQKVKYPELAWLYAIPNGGKRPIKTAIQLKLAGVKKGVSDICLPVKRGEFSGMYIELKTPHDKAWQSDKGSMTKEQVLFGDFVASQGFFFVVCYGWESAAETITGYLGK